MGVYTQVLNTTGGDAITSLAVGSGVSIYTQKVDTQRGIDSALVLVIAGTISVTQEVSVNGTDFYTPYDLGGRVSMGNVGSALVTTGMYIALNQVASCPVIAPYKRFVFQALSTSTISAYYLQQE
jgi:hypothetical protein